MVPRADLSILQGEEQIKKYTKTHIWGPDVTLYFCQSCSSALFKLVDRPSHINNYVIQSGVLDGEDGKLGADVEVPDEECYVEFRAQWLPATGLPMSDMVDMSRLQ